MDYRILGPIEVLDDGGSLELGKRMERALLALLIMHANTPVSADVCIDALWPNGAPAKADASLYALIARLRRRLEPGRQPHDPPSRLVRDPAGYRLVVAHSEMDLRRFKQAADRGRALLDVGDATNARIHLTAALDEWRGPALGEFAYDEFAAREALRLEELRVEVIEAELGARIATGDPNLVPELEAFVAEHPLREVAWTYLLVSLYRAGRQTEALRRAEALRGNLAEVGLDPSPRTRRIVDAILIHDDRLESNAFLLGVEAKGSTERPGLPRWWRPSEHFIGRASELDRLRTLWMQCQEGEVRIALVTGEPGIGKTALMIEASERASVGGAQVLAGRCSSTSSRSFEPITEAFDRLVGVWGDSKVEALGEHAPRLARLLPNHAGRLGGDHAGELPATESDRYLLFESVSALTNTIARETSLVLMIDDLQWADAGSLHLLDHLLGSDRSEQILILASVRREDLDADTRLKRFITKWVRDGVAITVELEGLSLNEVADLVGASANDLANERDGNGEAFIAELFAATGGNPYFVVEMVQHMRTSGSSPSLPASVQVLVSTRLDRLDPEHRRVLQVASLLTDRVDIELITRVLDDHNLVRSAVDAAVAAGLLINRGTMVLFQHHLVRSVLRDEIGPAQRAAWDRSLGDACVELAGDDPTPMIDRIAAHYLEAAADGDAREAVRYAKIAGDVAVDKLAFDTAASHFAAGIAAMERARGVDAGAAIELHLSLLKAWRLLGDNASIFRSCVDLADRMAREASLDQLRRFAWACLAGAMAASPAEGATLDANLARIEARIGDDHRAGDQDLAVVMLARAMVAFHNGDVAEAVDRLDQVLKAQSPSWDTELCVMIVDALVTVFGERRPIEERVRLVGALYARVIDEPEATPEQRLLTCSVARWAALTTGDLAAMAGLDARMETHALSLGMPRYLAGVAQRRSCLALIAGSIDFAEHHATEAFRHRPDDEFFEGYVAQLAMARMLQGRAAELDDALGLMEENANPAWIAGRALVSGEIGRFDEGRRLLADFVAGLDCWERDISWLGTLGLGVYAADVLRDSSVVGALQRALEPHVGRIAVAGISTLILGPVDLLLGMLATLAGDHASTWAHLNAAERALDGLNADVLRGRVALARAEVTIPGAPDAHIHARGALEIFERHGIQGSIRSRAQMLSQAVDRL